MKFPHWVVLALAVAFAAAPFIVQALPAKYAAMGPAILAVVAALKVQALGSDK